MWRVIGSLVKKTSRIMQLSTLWVYFERMKVNVSPLDWPNLFSNTVAHHLDPSVSDEEVKQVVFSIGSLKAPGEDGLPALFYQKSWDTFGPELTSFVRRCIN